MVIARITTLALLASFAGISLGQQSSHATMSIGKQIPVVTQPHPIAFSVDSALLQVHVVVLDKKDRLVEGLTRQDFGLYEDGVEQKIGHFSFDRAPVSMCVVLDASWSMERKVRPAVEALRLLLSLAQPGDEYCLIRIHNHAEVVAALTSNFAGFTSAATESSPGGLTALNDGIVLGLRQLTNATNLQKTVLVISDGGENNSRHTERETSQLIETGDIRVYGVSPPSEGGDSYYSVAEALGPSLVDRLAAFSGGRYFRAQRMKDARAAIRNVSSAVHRQYILGYYPDSPDSARTRQLSVQVTRSGSHVRAYWRPNTIQ